MSSPRVDVAEERVDIALLFVSPKFNATLLLTIGALHCKVIWLPSVYCKVWVTVTIVSLAGTMISPLKGLFLLAVPMAKGKASSLAPCG